MPVPGRQASSASAVQTVQAMLTAQPSAIAAGEQPTMESPAGPLPLVTVIPPPAAMRSTLGGDTYTYITQPGDTLPALALRFGVSTVELGGAQAAAPQALLPSGQRLTIPNRVQQTSVTAWQMPDSEVIYSPASLDFSTQDYVQSAAGFLSTYSETVDGQPLSGARIVQRVAEETSINPRLLLAFLEYRSHWVTGSPQVIQSTPYPIGFQADQYSGLYKEITLVARQLTIGYYGWRSGGVVELVFANQTHMRLDPTINAGTAALQMLFSRLYPLEALQQQLQDPAAFLAFYQAQFGDPWSRSLVVGALLPDGLVQPALELPFALGEPWSFTGGPHLAWGVGSSWGGLDFAPANVEKGCGVSRFWATAAASGVVLRSANGQVIQDLDGDGHEQTGWVLLYLHVAEKERAAVGTLLNVNDRVGHPSCEGGVATGTHVHLARKYNGEWIAADGALPFVLSGWRVWAAAKIYSGSLTKGDQVVTARPDGAHTSLITR